MQLDKIFDTELVFDKKRRELEYNLIKLKHNSGVYHKKHIIGLNDDNIYRKILKGLPNLKMVDTGDFIICTLDDESDYYLSPSIHLCLVSNLDNVFESTFTEKLRVFCSRYPIEKFDKDKIITYLYTSHIDREASMVFMILVYDIQPLITELR